MARLSHVLRDLFGLEISEGALVNILSASRKPFAAQTSLIKARLMAGTALASDETLPHTTRAALTGLRKRGYAVGIDRADKVRGSVYRIEPTEMEEDSAAPHAEASQTCEAPPDRPGRAANLRTRRAA